MLPLQHWKVTFFSSMGKQAKETSLLFKEQVKQLMCDAVPV